MGAPLFYFSYARADLKDAEIEGGNYLEQFYLDLEREIRRLRAFPPEAQIGFRDLEANGIQLGGEWQPELSYALSVCHTLICLYSPNFFASENCGKEVQVFLMRRQLMLKSMRKAPAMIIPVIWSHPSGIRHLPDVMASFQHTSDVLPKSYQELGIFNLRRLGNNVEYQRLLMSLADLVIQRCDANSLPPLKAPLRYEAIANAFDATNNISGHQGESEHDVAAATDSRVPPHGAVTESDQRKSSARTFGRLGWSFAVLFAISNLTILAGSFRLSILIVYRLFGFRGLTLLHSYMTVSVALLLVVAYAVGARAMRKWLIMSTSGSFILCSALPFTLATALLIANIQISRRQTDLDFVLIPPLKDNAYQLTDRLFQRQHLPGGCFGGAGGWDTAQSIVAALSEMGRAPTLVQAYADNIRHAVGCLESNMSPSEGWAEGTGKGPAVTEVTAWVTVAYLKTLDPGLAPDLWQGQSKDLMIGRVARNIRLLLSRQDPSGHWLAVAKHSDAARTYSAVMAIWALIEARRCTATNNQLDPNVDDSIRRGIERVLADYAEFNDFRAKPILGGSHQHHGGLEAQALYVLSQAGDQAASLLSSSPTYLKAKTAFLYELRHKKGPISTNTSLYSDDAWVGTDIMLEGSTYLWYPWTLLELHYLGRDPQLTPSDRKGAYDLELEMILRLNEAMEYVGSTDSIYVMAENLYALSEVAR